MHKAIFLTCLVVLVNSSGCDQQEQDKRIRSLESAVQQLKADVIQLKLKPPEHHYELRAEGLRTWRFDPATGNIQLTSEADWKRKETKSQSCECADKTQHYVEMPNTEQLNKLADQYYNFQVKPACGD